LSGFGEETGLVYAVSVEIRFKLCLDLCCELGRDQVLNYYPSIAVEDFDNRRASCIGSLGIETGECRSVRYGF